MKSNQSQWNNAMESLEDIIFNLSEDNIIKSVEKALNLKTQNFSPCSPLTICRLIYSSSLSQMKDFNIYLNFMKNLEAKENETSENQYELIKTFGNFLKDINSQESYFLLNKMIENNLISSKLIENKNSFYFAQYYPIDLIYKLKDNQNTPYQKYFDENYHKLSIRNWKLHKKFIEEGHNPDELARIIRNDEIEKLQEISSHPKFDFNQAIPNSLYERCDYINRRFDDVSLIDYAAFFGSIKCFKYLLMNNADVKRTGTYAVAGGNLEIVHLCEQNHSLFGNDAYETAIKFHRNDIFFYLYENSKIESFLFRDFLHLFLYSLDEYYNIKIFNFFLEQERIEINIENVDINFF